MIFIWTLTYTGTHDFRSHELNDLFNQTLDTREYKDYWLLLFSTPEVCQQYIAAIVCMQQIEN